MNPSQMTEDAHVHPTVRERLAERKAHLEKELRAINMAFDVLEKYPDFEEMLGIVTRALVR